jgi:hypothetical protein
VRRWQTAIMVIQGRCMGGLKRPHRNREAAEPSERVDSIAHGGKVLDADITPQRAGAGALAGYSCSFNSSLSRVCLAVCNYGAPHSLPMQHTSCPVRRLQI